MKRVTLTLKQGSFEEGFPAELGIWDDCQPDKGSSKIPGKLPPALEVLTAFKAWEVPYCELTKSRLTPRTDLPSNVSIPELARAFDDCFRTWLMKSGDGEWQRIREYLLRNLDVHEEILVIIETQDPDLRKLPWHLWDLFSDIYTKAEVVISAADYEPLPAQPTRSKPRLLAVLGNSRGIDVEKDRKILKKFLDVDIKFLVEPELADLMDLLWHQSWDIFYFAGHSCSRVDGNSGFLWIQDSAVPMEDLRSGLEQAIEKGMRIAIFNSCDGLGLAKELADLSIPQVVVMREPVPDLVAQEFLKYFLKFFAAGQPLYLAVRKARSRLREIEGSFPCASWLPVMCQNPAELPLPPPKVYWWQRLRGMLPIAMAVAACVIGIRQFGLLQTLELQAFDQLQQLRPQEQPDPRLLVVAVTEADIQKRKEWPLTDSTLSQVLSKLEQYEPQVIGLDIFHDFSIPKRDRSEQQDLWPHLLSPRLVGICTEGIPAPPGVPRARLGFSDVVVDDDGVLRRQLLFLQPDVQSSCPATGAFSLQLALHYLAARGIQPQLTSQEEYKIKNTLFKPLSAQRGSYRTTDTRGYQVLLNYRVHESPQGVARQVTLSEVLNNKVDPGWVKGRVVLIGVTAESVKDRFWTPYSRFGRPHQPLSGVLVQAQMVSQILGAVLDRRPLLWAWPDWAEGLWIVGWSVVGGVLVILVKSRVRLVFAIGVAVGGLVAICWGGLLSGGWLPLIPSALVLAITGGMEFVVRLKSPAKN